VYEPGSITGKGEEAKARKAMKHWKLRNDFWTAMQKGLHGYAQNPKVGVINTQFPPTYNNRRDHLKPVFRGIYKIGWDNLLKGRMGRKWIA
jgi:hypothetical protein